MSERKQRLSNFGDMPEDVIYNIREMLPRSDKKILGRTSKASARAERDMAYDNLSRLEKLPEGVAMVMLKNMSYKDLCSKHLSTKMSSLQKKVLEQMLYDVITQGDNRETFGYNALEQIMSNMSGKEVYKYFGEGIDLEYGQMDYIPNKYIRAAIKNLTKGKICHVLNLTLN